MNNPSIMLHVEITSIANNLCQITLHKGAQLYADVITPKRLIELQHGIREEPTLEERAEASILESVKGICTTDITGKCTLQEAVELIRAIDHKQDIKLTITDKAINNPNV